jgi:hypothetical protein
MTPDCKKPGVAFWATVAVTVLVGYPLSWGPIQYVATRNYDSLPEWAIVALVWYFTPLQWVNDCGPEWMQTAISRYLMFWLR